MRLTTLSRPQQLHKPQLGIVVAVWQNGCCDIQLLISAAAAPVTAMVPVVSVAIASVGTNAYHAHAIHTAQPIHSASMEQLACGALVLCRLRNILFRTAGGTVTRQNSATCVHLVELRFPQELGVWIATNATLMCVRPAHVPLP